MPLKTWILMLFGFAIYLRSSAKFCATRYVNGKWISKGDFGGLGRMSEMQKELQSKIKDEKKKECIAGNKWTVFQRRINGNVDFFRGWDDYKNGFGNRDGDLWLGLEELHNRTKGRDMELEINMILKDGGTRWTVKYSSFRIGPGSDNYTLHVSGYSGNATGSGLGSYHNGGQFSTKDADHDDCSAWNRTTFHDSGWWYGYGCGSSTNLNGDFHKTREKGIWWGGWDNQMRFSEMKFRKRS